jgi:3'-phosphoadenosine 5'-phosphosulfate (PAPS) 3'-phosphatase
VSAEFLSHSDIEFVCELVKEAGELALAMRSTVSVSEKAPGDLVTDADRALSKLIVENLVKRMPGDLIVSEEGDRQQSRSNRVWLIDPIDGTDHYVRNSRQFSVMIGLVCDNRPFFGWLYQPSERLLYFGGPDKGTYKSEDGGRPREVVVRTDLYSREAKRIIIGRGDARNHPWLQSMPGVTLIQVGSIGVKVIYLLEDRADIVAQMHGRMSVWDTAGPSAVALGAGLEIGAHTDFVPDLQFPSVYTANTFKQQFPIVFGRRGTLEWARQFLVKHE